MIEADARIVAIDSAALWVEGRSSLQCARCDKGRGCGMGSMRMGLGSGRHYMRINLDGRRHLDYRVGQTVSIGIPERVVTDGAVLVYLPPLLGLLLGVVAVDADGALLSLTAAVGGLLAGGFAAWGIGRWLALRCSWRPVLLD